MSNNFDYKEFAKSLETQCVELIPAEFCTQDKDYIIQKVYNFFLFLSIHDRLIQNHLKASVN